MKIELKNIPDDISALELSCKPEEIALEAEGVKFTGLVFAKLRFFRQPDTIFVNGDLSVDIELECDRCLCPVNSVLKGILEIQYRPMPKFSHEATDYEGIGYYSEDHIDLSDDIRESFLLEMPYGILCSEDCKGLCRKCGQNLNKGKCDCVLEPEEEAPVSKFAELIKKLEIK